MAATEKRCPKCQSHKPAADFYRNSRRPDGLDAYCKACQAQRARAWRETNAARHRANFQRWEHEHKESRLEQGRQYCATHREQKDEYLRRWRAENKERTTAQHARWLEANAARAAAATQRWREANKERLAAKARAWREANKEKIAARQRERRASDPVPHRIHENNRRARKKGNGGAYTPEEWRTLCERYDHRCAHCGKTGKLTADHIVPLSRGGSGDISNIQPLCLSCNCSKGGRLV